VSFVIFVAVTVFVSFVAAQGDVTDAQLSAASGGRTVRLGPAAGRRGPVATVPLEVYVARVLAGEAEPRAADAAYQALAVAIRTFALANEGRHARDGFDLCDTTHCQVPRAATAVTRRAAMATAGQILTWNGAPAEVFYSASCGGRSERADAVWPGADYPYMLSVRDDVHDDDEPWVFETTLADVQRALRSAGFTGRLTDVDVEERNESGRASTMRIRGMDPGEIAGDDFRAAVGAVRLRSTAFAVDRDGSTLRFTGRGYGHGVGMCVIGAGRRAARGETVGEILVRYYPGLQLARLDVGRALSGPPGEPNRARPNEEPASRTSTIVDGDVAARAARAHDALAGALGISIAPLQVRVHPSLDSFRRSTGAPWWVSSVSEGTSIDLVPLALLDQRNGVDEALRIAVAELLVADSLRGRPLWVRVGAARYFGRQAPAPPPSGRGPRCPSDAELRLAISATAQRDAESRAEACFAREYAKTKDWRAVR
jgi:stage II sporulation protein D